MIRLFVPGDPYLANHARRIHHQQKARIIAEWKLAARAATPRKARKTAPCVVACRLHRTDRRTTDAGAISPTLKACIDGLVDAGVWPDDTPEHVLGELCLPPLYRQPVSGVELLLCDPDDLPQLFEVTLP